MNRIIKFRAWNQDLKRMGYSDDNYFKTRGWWGWILVGNEELGGEIVMQFTGLTDKNGKEIYEGDVVKFRKHPEKTKVGQVVWSKNKPELTILEAEIGGLYRSFNGTNSIEVIGNIYENPELLTPKEDE
jgi:uncharacterized phage protein (TIGR01671 family)